MGKKQLAAKVLLGLVALGSGVIFGGVEGFAAERIFIGTNNPSNSTITITGAGTVTVAQAFDESSSLVSSTVLLTGTSNNNIVYGGTADSGTVSGNRVSIGNTLGTVSVSLLGGTGHKGANLSNNIVTITGGNFASESETVGAFGGNVFDSGNSSGNAVNISGGTFSSNTVFVGGGTEEGTASNNKVSINDLTAEDTVTIAGGYSDGSGGVSGNTATIVNGTFKKEATVYGGGSINSSTGSGTGVVSGNAATINGGQFNGLDVTVTGGMSGTGTVSNNTAVINGGTFDGFVGILGGNSDSGVVSGNKVIIGDGTFTYEVTGYGGESDDSAVSGNTVEISGGKFDDNVEAAGGNSDSGTVSDNTVIVGDGSFANRVSVYGGHSESGNASHNFVSITGGDLTESIYAYGGSTISAEAVGNIITVTGGNFMDAHIVGGSSESGVASGNMVTVSGGTFAAKSSQSGVLGGFTIEGKVSDNTVTISNGTFQDLIIAGGGSVSGTVTDNIANINGGTMTNVRIKGGDSITGPQSGNVINLRAADGEAVFKGGVKLANAETLNVYGKNYTVDSVENINNYNFYIPRNAAANDTMLTVENTTADTFANTKINGGVQPGSHLVKGDKVTLIEAKDGNVIVDSATVPEKASLTEGVSRRYDLGLAKDGNKVVATVDNVASKDQTKSLVETRMATMTLINQGSDMLASTGFQQAAAAAEGSRGFEPFFAVSGGKLKADTGSHVDTKGIGMNLGLAKKIDNGAGSLLIGPVVEYGRGSYDSYIDDGIHGSGDSHYWGVGLMAKQTNDNGFYYEGSIRVGKSKADYHTDDMNEHTTHVSYDTEGTYWAAHLGLGKVQEISDKNSMDYYAKYFYSHQASDKVHLSTGEDYRFDSVNSSRIRLGARYLHDFGTANRFYGGLAYQYEFSSSAKAHYDGDSTPSPDVKGSSGLIELGAVLKSSKDSPLSVDVGVNGWVGKMKGVTFGVKLGYSF